MLKEEFSSVLQASSRDELLVKVVEASLVAEAEAVFETVPQLADEVVATTCTVELPPAFKDVGA